MKISAIITALTALVASLALYLNPQHKTVGDLPPLALDVTPVSQKVSLQLAHIVGTRYVFEFKDKNGQIVEQETDAATYFKAAHDAVKPTMKNATFFASYATPLFDTASGKLEDGQYAVDPDHPASSTYVKVSGKGMESVERLKIVGDQLDILDLQTK